LPAPSKDTPQGVSFSCLEQATHVEHVAQAKRGAIGFAFSPQSASSSLVSGKAKNIRLRNSRSSKQGHTARCVFFLLGAGNPRFDYEIPVLPANHTARCVFFLLGAGNPRFDYEIPIPPKAHRKVCLICTASAFLLFMLFILIYFFKCDIIIW